MRAAEEAPEIAVSASALTSASASSLEREEFDDDDEWRGRERRERERDRSRPERNGGRERKTINKMDNDNYSSNECKRAYPLYNSLGLEAKPLLISCDIVVKTQEIAITESQGERLMDEENSPKTNDIVAISPISKYVVRQQWTRFTCPRSKTKSRYKTSPQTHLYDAIR